MATEEVDPRFVDLDAWQLSSAMEAMWEGQLAAIAVIGHALPAITEKQAGIEHVGIVPQHAMTVQDVGRDHDERSRFYRLTRDFVRS